MAATEVVGIFKGMLVACAAEVAALTAAELAEAAAVEEAVVERVLWVAGVVVLDGTGAEARMPCEETEEWGSLQSFPPGCLSSWAADAAAGDSSGETSELSTSAEPPAASCVTWG